MKIQQKIKTPHQQNIIHTLFAEQETVLLTGQVRTREAKHRPGLYSLREILEVAFGLSIITIGSSFLPGAWISSHLIFCAFFLVVFAVAVRYSKVTAYSAGLLAALGYSLLLWYHPELRAQFDLPHFLIEPFLLLISGVLVNDLLLAQFRRFIMAEQQHIRNGELLHETIQQFQDALMINAELEWQIAGQPISIAMISDKMMQLWERNGTERYAAVLDIVMHALEAQSCALYMQRNGQISLCASRAVESVEHAATLNLDDPLIRRVIRQRQVSSVHDLLAEEKMVSQKAAVMAGPLIDRNGQIVGIVIVDHVPLLKFTSRMVRLFSSILQMSSIALHMALITSEPDLSRRKTEALRSFTESGVSLKDSGEITVIQDPRKRMSHRHLSSPLS